MPMAADYDGWAAELDEWAQALASDTELVWSAWAAGPITGGRRAQQAERAVVGLTERTADAAGDLGRLADECRRRAQVCAGYTADLVAYERSRAAHRDALTGLGPEAPPPAPDRPVRPAQWAEAGLRG